MIVLSVSYFDLIHYNLLSLQFSAFIWKGKQTLILWKTNKFYKINEDKNIIRYIIFIDFSCDGFIRFINQSNVKKAWLSIIAMTRFVSARSANCKFRGRIRGRLALSAVQMAQLVLIYLLFARSLGKEKDACDSAARTNAHACDTMLSLRSGRHRVTYIVMGPPLVSKIGCRATTFQTTRDSYGPRASIRERRKFHANASVNCM